VGAQILDNLIRNDNQTKHPAPPLSGGAEAGNVSSDGGISKNGKGAVAAVGIYDKGSSDRTTGNSLVHSVKVGDEKLGNVRRMKRKHSSMSGNDGQKETFGTMVCKYNKDSNITNDPCCKYMNTSDTSIYDGNDGGILNRSVMDIGNKQVGLNKTKKMV